MKQVRGSVDDAIVALLAKPLTRLLVRRARRQMAQRARTAVVVPLEELWQAALSGPVAAAAHGLETTGLVGYVQAGKTQVASRDRQVLHGLVIAAAVAALVASLAFIVAAIVRSRRRPAQVVSATAPAATGSASEPSQAPDGSEQESARRMHAIGVSSEAPVASTEA
jgi:hypothetical protein